ncbi:MAG: hypothetical protein ACKV2T_01780 [Kofleriaceae bacterium]
MTKTLSILLFVASCTGAHRELASDAGIDAPPACGGEVCDDPPEAACIDGDTLRSYEATCEADTCSYPETEVECGALGCCDDHCCAVSPSSSVELGGLVSNGLEVEVLDGTFDTSTECTEGASLGSCSVVARATLGEACVCRADKIRIGNLRVTGTRALVLFAHREVLVTGTLDLSAQKNVDGPGASYVTPPDPGGAPGGSYGSRGGASGAVQSSGVAGMQTLSPLAGGMRGADGGGLGGGGGGAIQITAGFRVDLVGTIDVGGGGGRARGAMQPDLRGGGGGSGGAILLEAPTVIVGGRLLANGGGGGGGSGGGSNGTDGWDAAMVRTQNVPITEPPRGGSPGHYTCPNWYVTHASAGGAGATGMNMAQPGGGNISTYCSGAGPYLLGSGGGGGGVGRIRINTTNECQCTGVVLPAATFGTVITR